MWFQILAALIPTLGVAIPIIGLALHKAKSRAEIALAARTGVAPLAKGGAIGQAAQSVADDAQQRSSIAQKVLNAQTDQGSGRFAVALQELERRALENSDHNIYGYLSSLLEELQSLESKLSLSGLDQQARLTYAKYFPLVGKIIELTAPNYYGDFVRNPDHWNDPKRMRVQVELSVLAVAKEVSEDIRRLNSSQELNFQVSVESLIGKAAASAEKKDSDSALEELLKEDGGILLETSGDLESLQLAVAAEASALQQRLAQEKEAQNKVDQEKSAKKFKAGAKRSLEIQVSEAGPRRVLTTRDVLKQRWTIYGAGGTDSNYLVAYQNSITGKAGWKSFSSAYEAADWVDSSIAEEEKNHDFKCSCVYCREAD